MLIAYSHPSYRRLHMFFIPIGDTIWALIWGRALLVLDSSGGHPD